MHSTISKYWFCQIAGWGIYVIVYSLLSLILHQSGQDYFFYKVMLDAFLGLAVTHLMHLFIHKMRFLQEPVPVQIFYFVLTTAIFCIFYASAAIFLAEKLQIAPHHEGLEFVDQVVRALFGISLFLIIWNLIYFTYHFVMRSKVTSPQTFKATGL